MPGVKVRDFFFYRAMRTLKKKMDREGIMKTIKKHQFYDKPSQARRAKSKAARSYRTKRR